jgi:type I restriction enzyme S subunit
VLADDTFFDYSMATSKGTKMPRGDKKAIMEYEVPKIPFEEQCKIAATLEGIDEKIELNTAINKNLASHPCGEMSVRSANEETAEQFSSLVVA